jgi:pimeloyl-ACP methyl ester carboxylesterase
MAFLSTKDGARIHYKLQGKQIGRSPVLLFIHGWCSNLEHWAPQAKHFSRTHRVLRVDRRGLGKSTTPGTGHTAKQHAADIAAVARAAGVRRVVAIGHAGGGPCTLELTRTYPKLVKAAVMVDSGMYPKPRLNDPKSPFGMVLGPMADALRSPNGKAAFKQMYQGFFSPKCDKAVTRQAVADAMRTPMDVVIDEIDVMAVSTQRIADDIEQPVLWLTAVGVDQGYIGKHLKNVQFAQVAGSGHFPQLEVPDQTNAMIETFVKQLA